MKNLKTILILFSLALLAIFNVPTQQVQAVESIINLPLNNQAVSLSFTDEKDEYIYEIKTEKPGTVKLKFTSDISSIYFYLLDSNLNELSDCYSYVDEDTSSLVLDLEPGTYNLKLQSYSTKNYTLSGSFTPANNIDISQNDTINTATALTLDGKSKIGFFSINDKLDIYKFIPNSPGKVTLTLSSTKDLEYIILDKTGNQIQYYGGNISHDYKESTLKSSTVSLNLSTDTYYLKVINDYDNNGVYNINASLKPANNSDVEPNDTISTANTLSLDNATKTGFFSINDEKDIYKFTTSASGRVTLTISSYMEDLNYEILDGKGAIISEYYKDYIIGGSESSSKSSTINIDLDAGTYYLKIDKYIDTTGIYTIKGSFKASNTQDNGNNSFSKAQTLSVDGKEFKGFLGVLGESDYYKVILSKKGYLGVAFNSYKQTSYADITIYNDKFTKVTDFYTGSDIDFSDKELEKGTYYIKISKSNNYTGVYGLKLGFVSGLATYNSINDKTTVVTGSTDPYNIIELIINKKSYKTSASSTGKYSLTIPLTSAGTQIEFRTFELNYNRYYYKSITVTGSVPNKPTVSAVNNKATTITGKTEAKITVYAKIGSKTYTTTSDANGNFKFTIPTQNSGTVITITSKNKIGVSSATTVTVASVAPNKPTVNSVNNKATTITGKTDVKITVYAKIGSKTYTTTSDSKGNFKFTIPVQNSGTLITITAKNSKGVSVANTITVSAIAPNKPTVNAVNNKAATITGKTEAKITVYAKIGSKTYTTTSDSKGNFKFTIPIQNSATVITITAKNSKGTSIENKITVSKAAPNKPVASNIKSSATKITGTAEKNTTVYAKIGSKTYSAKANSKGQFSITIPKQKVNTKISITVKDAAKKESAVTTVSVVK